MTLQRLYRFKKYKEESVKQELAEGIKNLLSTLNKEKLSNNE